MTVYMINRGLKIQIFVHYECRHYNMMFIITMQFAYKYNVYVKYMYLIENGSTIVVFPSFEMFCQ